MRETATDLLLEKSDFTNYNLFTSTDGTTYLVELETLEEINAAKENGIMTDETLSITFEWQTNKDFQSNTRNIIREYLTSYYMAIANDNFRDDNNSELMFLLLMGEIKIPNNMTDIELIEECQGMNTHFRDDLDIIYFG